jgi:hypothetical protein
MEGVRVHRAVSAFIAAVAITASVAVWGTARAESSAERCEASKLTTAGKYDFCRLKAEAKAAKTGGAPDFSRCDPPFSVKWTQAETNAGGMCPSHGDQAAVQAFITEHTDALEAALEGGTLPEGVLSCNADLATCNGSLSTCNANDASCNSSLSTCSGNLSTCTGNLGTCNTSLSTCNSNDATCNSNLSSCNGNLGTCTGNLGTCNSNYASCSSTLTACNGNLGACTGDLGTCNSSLTTCSSNFATCTSSLSTCDGDLSACGSSLATVSAGTAMLGDVLTGKTFSSAAGIGLTGAMPNNGAVNITPGTMPQAIPAGYHNGAGSVAGDVNLAGGNIVTGVSVFGVVGTQPPSQPLKTRQTTAYGTGTDGDLQKGDARSYTDNGDGTITDNRTGLMWEKKSRDGSIHDYGNSYTWSGASYPGPDIMDGTITSTFLATLNGGGGFAGHTDWRIPNRFELETIANLDNQTPAVDTAFNTNCVASCTVTTCSCTWASLYWSSTTWQGNPAGAWYVDFIDGLVNFSAKSFGYFARAVRGGS